MRDSVKLQDVIGELCSVIGVDDDNEKEEFSLYCIVEGEPFTVPLTKDHYILDVTTGKKSLQQAFFLNISLELDWALEH